MIEFMVKAVRDSMTAIRDAALKKPNTRHLRTLSEKISRNTLRPMQVPPGCSVDKFVSLFTGDGLRWETLGIYFTLVGQGALTLQDSDHSDRELFKETFRFEDGTFVDGLPRNDSNIDKKQIANQMISAGEMCVTYSDQAGNPNDLTVWLLYELTILISIAHGDDSKILFLWIPAKGISALLKPRKSAL